MEDWPDDGLPLADVNIWHWADDRIQTAQIRQASRDRDRTYLAAVHLGENRLVPLADEGMRTVDLTRDGRWGMGQDDSNFISDWKPSLANYYRVDTRTGERIQVLRAHERTFGFSPDSKHFLYWLDGHIWDYRVDENIHLNLTASSPVDFTDMEFDHFGERPSYGVVGWSSDGESVLLNHRYDVWLQPLDGTSASNLTGGRGARDEVRLRYVRTDPEERFIDLDQPILFSAYGEWTKKEGFFELGDGVLSELTWEDKKFGRVQKAQDADRYLFTVETFQEFPDLWSSTRDFSNREACNGRESPAGGVPVGTQDPLRLHQRRRRAPPGYSGHSGRLRGRAEAADDREVLRGVFAGPPRLSDPRLPAFPELCRLREQRVPDHAARHSLPCRDAPTATCWSASRRRSGRSSRWGT